MRRALLDALRDARTEKRPVILATRFDDGAQALISPHHVDGDTALAETVADAAHEALRHDRSATVDTESGQVFLHVFNPPLRLILVGAVHISQALAPMALHAGYQVTVVDPRRAFATESRFPGLRVSTDWPDNALKQLMPDRRTAIVTLTHDPKLDDPALHVALRSDAFYIGSLGSKKTHGGRLERLAAVGFSESDCARIHGPVGLSIGAKSPGEIAVSILAQITAVLHTGAAP